jgi:DNA-binding XRE family transcriptional regulator
MSANKLIQRAREELGLSQPEVARLATLSAAEYRDIEQYAEEILTAVPLSKVKVLCSILHLDVLSLVAAAYPQRPSEADPTQAPSMPRHALVRFYREKCGASESAVADAIGFQPEAVAKGESDDSYLESLPVSVLREWALFTNMPLVRMLDVQRY